MDRIHHHDDDELEGSVKCPECGKGVERRDSTAQIFYTRRLNRILVLSVMMLIAALLSLTALLFSYWERQQDRYLNTYLACRVLWDRGVTDPWCKDYESIFRALDKEKPGDTRRGQETILDPRTAVK